MLDLPEKAMKEVEKYAVRDSNGNQIGVTDNSSEVAKKTWEMIEDHFNSQKISFIKLLNDSCANQSVDAVVNAANAYLQDGSGICGVIFNKCGNAELQVECNKYPRPRKEGDAVVTPALKMKNAKIIIHAVGPDFRVKLGKFKELYEAYYNSLICLKNERLHSISFPLISSSIFAGKTPNPVTESTKQCCRAYRKFRSDFPEYYIDVKLCAYKKSEYDEAKMEFERQDPNSN